MTREMKENTSSFFRYINEECLFYKVDVMADGSITTKWDNLTEQDYSEPPGPLVDNRIIIRVHKAKNHMYFLDFFQCQAAQKRWHGFAFKTFAGHDYDPPAASVSLRFYHPDITPPILHVVNVPVEVVLLLQQFFHGFA